jgi:hypothetical protein
MTMKTCASCGVEFKSRYVDAVRVPKFCSATCYHEAQRGHSRGPRSPDVRARIGSAHHARYEREGAYYAPPETILTTYENGGTIVSVAAFLRTPVSYVRSVLAASGAARRRQPSDLARSHLVEGQRRRRTREGGVSRAQLYENLLATQHGLCAICQRPETRMQSGRPSRLAFDHDHSTGRIRGLLCHGCNTFLGLAREDPTVLTAAIDYLRRPPLEVRLRPRRAEQGHQNCTLA